MAFNIGKRKYEIKELLVFFGNFWFVIAETCFRIMVAWTVVLYGIDNEILWGESGWSWAFIIFSFIFYPIFRHSLDYYYFKMIDKENIERDEYGRKRK